MAPTLLTAQNGTVEITVLNKLNTAYRTQRASRVYGIDTLCKLLEDYMSPEHVSLVREAHTFGEERHKGQFRKSGEPYIYHPLAVARILAELHMDHTTIMAAILHDVIEDTSTARHEIEEKFGSEVALLVDGVSKLSRVHFQSREEQQAESFRKLLLAMTEDLRVIMVKLADRLHNMRTLDSVSDVQRRRVARETLEVYAPIAHRLGINLLRVQLEDLGFQNLYPNRHLVLSKAVRRVTGNRSDLVREIEERLSKALKEEQIQSEVIGRKKNIYSIYNKMRRKHLRFLDVFDLYGFRIIVNSVDECYRALGIIHFVYRPISEQFNDFLANPKVNGYQSLHTTLVGPSGVKIEVQIRTREMHKIAESGIAAHWMYKLGKTRIRPPHVRARDWLGGLMEDQGGLSSLEFMENVKVDLFPEESYMFTPKGRIVRLPKGSTPVDFAYAVHTELGNQCVAARVDNQLAPLGVELRNGQTVEIITARHARPNAAWLEFVRTAKARGNIRHSLKNLRRDEAVKLGQRLLNRSLRELGIPVRKLDEKRLKQVLRQNQAGSLEDLYAGIGLGERLAPLVARQFLPADQVVTTSRAAPLAIEGTEGLVVSYARCCNPVPGDVIIGRVSVGRGVVIHRANCPQGKGRKADGRKRDTKSKQDIIDLRWSKRVRGDFRVELLVQAETRRGTLAKMATQIAEVGCNIENVKMPAQNDPVAVTRFLISVEDRDQLARVMRRLKGLEAVQSVSRA